MALSNESFFNKSNNVVTNSSILLHNMTAAIIHHYYTADTNNHFENANDILEISSTFNTTTNSISGYYNSLELNLSPCDPDNTAFNCTVKEFLLHLRGPQRLPLAITLPVTILFIVILITGVVGNVTVCIVVAKNAIMHTATNYYLFSLAVSDLMFLIMGLPYEISIYWHQYPYNLGLAFCKIRALVSEASTYVSVLTIVAFTTERFLAICYPFQLYKMSGLSRVILIITALWIVSFISAIPFSIFTKIDFLEYPPDNSTIYESAFCAMLENPPGFPLWELSFCFFFVIPMILILVLYTRIGYQIWLRTEPGVPLRQRNKTSHHHESRKSIIRMLAVVVITFFVCWVPFHAQRLTYIYAREWDYFEDMNEWLFSVGGWFYYVTCTINPIIYNIMSERYRNAFKETLFGKKFIQNKNSVAYQQQSFRESTFRSSMSQKSKRVHSYSLNNNKIAFDEQKQVLEI